MKAITGKDIRAMRKLLRIILLLVIAVMLPAACRAGRSAMLETALSFLEETNPFLLHYNETEGTRFQARCPLGCPYFWGGRHVKSLLRVESPSHSSDYYHSDQKYLYGLDCSGFTLYIVQQAGYEAHPKISDLLNKSLYTEYALNRANRLTGEERASVLRTGDLLAIQHESGGFHIAMYCGTLADYGYTEETLPEALVPYLRYPLLIHCTGSSDYHERYREYLEALAMTDVIPPFGGVIVSILDVPAEAATSKTPDVEGLISQPCFDLEGYHLQVTDLTLEKRSRWIRWRKRP